MGRNYRITKIDHFLLNRIRFVVFWNIPCYSGPHAYVYLLVAFAEGLAAGKVLSSAADWASQPVSDIVGIGLCEKISNRTAKWSWRNRESSTQFEPYPYSDCGVVQKLKYLMPPASNSHDTEQQPLMRIIRSLRVELWKREKDGTASCERSAVAC